MNIGKEQGDMCNRDGCDGQMQEHDRDGCCSCHISPPCGWCVHGPEIRCNECDSCVDDDID